MFDDKLTSLLVVLDFGSLMMLAILNFTNPLKVNRVANRWFGLFLLLWSSFFLDEIVFLLYSVKSDSVWYILPRFIQYFGPMVFYLSVVLYSNPAVKIKKIILPHLIVPLFYLAGLYYYYFREHSAAVNIALIFLLLGQTLFYSLLSWTIIRKHQKRVLLYSSNIHEVDLFWLERLIIGVLMLIIVIIMYNIFFYSKSLNVAMLAIQLIVIYIIAYHSLRQKEIFPFSEANRTEILSMDEKQDVEEIKKKIVSDEEIVVLKNHLNQYMLIHKPYLDPEINLVKLAEMFSITPHKLSYIINTGFNRNFFNFINAYRVEEAKSLLLDPKMDQYSVLGIAFESGFNSKTSFNSTFKNITGLTPTDFKKNSTVEIHQAN